MGRETFHAFIFKQDMPTIGNIKTGDEIEKSGFTRTVWAYNAYYQALFNFQSYVLDCDNTSKLLTQFFYV